MIKTFRHRGLQRYFDTGDHRDLRADQIKRIRQILAILDSAASIESLNTLPGMKLHSLKGDLVGYWSVWGTGNWRIILRIDEGYMYDVDFVDYH